MKQGGNHEDTAKGKRRVDKGTSGDRRENREEEDAKAGVQGMHPLFSPLSLPLSALVLCTRLL